MAKKPGKEKNISRIIFYVFVAIFVAVVSTITVTYAWFTDVVENGTGVTVSFGNVSVAGSTATDFSLELFLSPTELLPNYDQYNQPIPVTRTFTITNNGNVNIFTRFKATIKIYDGSTVLLNDASSYVALSGISPTTGDGSWQTYNSDGYYYYCTNSTTLKSVAPLATPSATLSFTINNSFGNEYAGKTIKVIFDIDAVQAANNSATLSSANWSE